MTIFNFKVPDISGYEVNYYFSNNDLPQQAKTYPFHMHDHVELYVLLEGDVSFAVESSLYKLSPGDVIVTKPNEMHNCILNSDSLHKHMCMWFECSSGFIFDDFLSHDFGKNNLISPDAETKEKLLSLYDGLKNATEANDTLKQFSITLEILYNLRIFISKSDTSLQLPDSLAKILRYVDEKFTEINGVEQILAKNFISRSNLNRLFKTYLHTTPKKYLESKKLAYSRLLLRRGKSVLEACTEAGFHDVSNYIRMFKRTFSVTPGQYKDDKKE